MVHNTDGLLVEARSHRTGSRVFRFACERLHCGRLRSAYFRHSPAAAPAMDIGARNLPFAPGDCESVRFALPSPS